ncbi:MAG: hypothetical protein ABI813_10915, partial [Bacteroidota bacterium]
SVFVSYIFAVQFWRDLNKLPAHSIAHSWFKAAVFFNALSSVGVMGLAYIMVTKNNHPAVYLGSIYFYLHFQYNGWFFFACMGLLSALLIEHGVAGASLKNVYRLFTVACLPAYLLSVLWLPLPNWIYALMVVAVFLQIGGWLLLLGLISPFLTRIRNSTPPIAQKLLLLSGIAASIKLLLQAGSVIPSLSKLAFGFRPIVIGYLHLVLLGIITLFITGYVIAQNYISVSKLMVRGLAIFVLGILFNELLLMTQGIADIGYHVITNINGLLLLAAMLLFTGIALFNYGMQKSTK